MNFLAHAWLSFDHEEVLVGNMIADFVKGRRRFGYPPGIQAGIALHRQIDAYTDEHPATREAKAVLRPAYRLYAGALMDVIYDHFLACNENAFPGGTLAPFAQRVYGTLYRFEAQLPAGFAPVLPYMHRDDWLTNYANRPGLARALHGLVRRSRYLESADEAIRIIEVEYAFLESCAGRFLADVKPWAKTAFHALLPAGGDDFPPRSY